MKKTVLTLALLSIAAGAFAQKSKLRATRDYLSTNDYRKALPEIDAAVQNDETKTNPEAWYFRGRAYLLQSMDSTARTTSSIDEAQSSFTKALELKPDYNNDINTDLYNLAIIAYQDAITRYNKGDYAKAYDHFLMAYNIYANNGKRMATNAKFKELAFNAKQNAAASAQNAHDADNALRLLLEIRNEQSPKDTNTYFSIIEILERQKKYDQLISMINEANTLFPNNKLIRNSEINYYINTNKTEQLLPKLETAVQSDPNNGDLYFMIGNLYVGQSFPKDANGKLIDRPANADETFNKAEAAYKKAVAINSNSAEFNYNMAVLYYSLAVEYNRQLNKITGNTTADSKKYDEFVAKRNAQFALALPYFEKTYSILDPKAASLSTGDRATYSNAVTGMLEIYSRQNNKAKVDELRKKAAELNK